MTKAIGRQKKPSDDGLPCNGPYRGGQKPLVILVDFYLNVIKSKVENKISRKMT